MRRKKRRSAMELAGWAAAGFVAGVVGGALLAQWVGDVNTGRVRRAVTDLRRPRRPAPTAAALAAAARVALEQVPELAALGLEVRRVSRGVVELHGWVPSRALRARAARAVLAVPGVETIINNLLVRGEDDEPTTDVIPISDRPA
ncbi:MAG TPA: BON domain-containing protein [Gemmatimonadales bacterium]|nr:BON domain-containing protein [Gemmatimonadales bacterium]